jgi:phosphate binding protein
MRRVLSTTLFVLIALSMALSACSPAATPTAEPNTAPTSAPAEPTAAEPTSAPAATEPTATSEAPAQTGVVLPEVDPSAVSGDIYAAGSSTVYPVSEKISEMFTDEGFTGTIKLDSIGSGAGFERFCKTGETDVSNASRAIKDSEVEACQAIGRTPIEFRVGTDALAIVVNKNNTWLTNVTTEELAKIFSSDATNWSDVNPDWPAEPIKRYAPGTDSGTYDFFVEFVMDKVYGDEGEQKFLDAQHQASEDDNVLVQGVSGDEYAIGFFGYAYYNENADILNILSVDGVAPDYDTAESGAYPLARPLFIYSDAKIMADKPQVAAYINYYLTNVSDMIGEVGYFPASADAMNAAKQAWLDAVNSATTASAAVELPAVDPAAAEGDIYAAGSSTVYPVSEKISEMFTDEGFTGTIKLDSIGSGAGFERFCKTGETDVSNASRAIKDSEVEACQAIGRTPIEFRVGTDALAIVVNKNNTWLTNVTTEELAKIFSSDATNWSDVNPDWPAEPIKRYAPGTDSGTYDFFVEFVMDKVYGDEGEQKFLDAQHQASEDDNVLVQGVSGDEFAIGFFGYAYYNENADILKILSVDGVAPDYDTAESGAYPLARPLFIYSDAKIMADKPQVAAYINYYLTNVSDMIGEVGYFPASADAMNASKQAWLDASAQ